MCKKRFRFLVETLMIFVISPVCCNQNTSQFEIELGKANCCGFKQEIHKTKTGGLDPSYLILTEKILPFGPLTDVSKGVDSFEFRVWYPRSVDTIMVFVFRYDSNWVCSLFKYRGEIDERGDLTKFWEIQDHFDHTAKIQSLLKTLTHENIFLLRHYLELDGYDIATPDDLVIFELAGKNFYRCISYAGLMRQSTKISEVQIAQSIVRFLDKNFQTAIEDGLRKWTY